jgi:hypothetical protein
MILEEGEMPVNLVRTPGFKCCQEVLRPPAGEQGFGWQLATV